MTEARHDTLWRRVEAHLDARTDPFQDAALARELRAVPEAERAARRVLARLDALRGMASSVATGSAHAASADGMSSTAPTRAPSRWRASRRVGALAACAAAAAALVALVHDTPAPRANPTSAEPSSGAPAGIGLAVAAFDARPELGVIYSARVELEHSVPPPPRAALVVHESRHVFGWSIAGTPR